MGAKFYTGLGKVISWQQLPSSKLMGLTYDNVLINPLADTEVESRKNPDTSIKFGPYNLTKPIISAPMDTVTGEKMIRVLAELGAIGSLPRYKPSQRSDFIKICENLSADKIPCLYSVGLKNAIQDTNDLYQRGAKMILIDIANGGMLRVKEVAKEIKKKFKKIWLVVGNIANYSQAKAYQNAGIDYARVGVGGGGVCVTRLVAGAGVPQLSSVFDTVASGINVIADGGIKKSADFAKALAAGAKMVMIGSMFAGTDEAPGEIIKMDDGEYSILRGQASQPYMEEHGIEINDSNGRVPEGVETLVKRKGSVKLTVRQLMGGLRSAMSYSGSKNLEEFQKKAQFIRLDYASLQENGPHAFEKSR